MSKIINFITNPNYLLSDPPLPKPIKLNIPEWYKKLKSSHELLTIKGCMPFLDTLTTGYVLELPQDFVLVHNIIENGKQITKFEPSLYNKPNGLNMNFKEETQSHAPEQLKGSPLEHKNLHLPVHKILNPWIIKTPPGYSCLFVPPLNNTDDRFSIIPGIVDTDKFQNEINFPFIVNGDKYSVLNTILKKKTPYVQIIPFKRENWQMKIGKITKQDPINYWKYLTNFFQQYKTKFHQRKQWR